MDVGKVTAKAQEKAEKMKTYLNQHMKNKFGEIEERKERREQLEKTMESMKLSHDVKRQMQAKLEQEETKYARQRRKKITVNDFDIVAIVGRGAFGEVRVVKKKDSKKVYAMKVMKKTEMLKKKSGATYPSRKRRVSFSR